MITVVIEINVCAVVYSVIGDVLKLLFDLLKIICLAIRDECLTVVYGNYCFHIS